MSGVNKKGATVPGPVHVQRAAGDLRRGQPVVIRTPRGALPVLAAERASAASLGAFAELMGGPLAVLVTPARARTLKIRLYHAEGAAVPLSAPVSAPPSLRLVHHLADPTSDLGDPMMGPFESVREALPAGAEAALQLAKIAELLPALVFPLAQPPGRLARRLLTVRSRDIDRFARDAAAGLERVVAAKVPLEGAENTQIIAFRPAGSGPENLAIVVGSPDLSKPVLVRLHSECFTGDLLGSLKCDCGEQLRGALAAMTKDGAGILLYLAQEGRGIGLLNKLRAYALQDQGFDTMEANERLGFEADERLFRVAAKMLDMLGVRQVRLMTNNPEKVESLKALGIAVVERVPHSFPSNPHNARYLAVKAEKGGHQF